jgi:hypothetical protein
VAQPAVPEEEGCACEALLTVVVVVLVMATMLLAMAMPVFADKGGVPNEKACHGQVVKTENQLGTTPHEGVQQLGLNNAGELHKEVLTVSVSYGAGAFRPGSFCHVGNRTSENSSSKAVVNEIGPLLRCLF